MEVTAMAKTDYDINMKVTEDELNQLIDEIEVIFIRSVKEGRTNEIQRLTELKNLLTMSVNNI